MTATTDIADLLPVGSIRFSLDYGQETSGKGSGDLVVADLRPARWTANITTTNMSFDLFGRVSALIDALDGSIGTFLLFDPSHAYPLSDPDGSVVGSSATKIKSVGSDGKSLSLRGLPSGYVLTRGDMLQVTYASGRIALHRIIEADVVADSSGETSEFKVRPKIIAGMAANDVVNLKKPCAEFRMVPGTLDSNVTPFSGTLNFQAIQKL
jgi:hypothetical protein